MIDNLFQAMVVKGVDVNVGLHQGSALSLCFFCNRNGYDTG